MKNEYSEADFEKGVKNPYFEKINRKVDITVDNKVVTIPVRHTSYDVFSELARHTNETPEIIMRRLFMDFVAELGKAAVDVVEEVGQNSMASEYDKKMLKFASLLAKAGIDTVNYIAKEVDD